MNPSQSLISVIVPVYNVEKYLHRCIDSIIHQTYTNLEIILIDDGSTDNCAAIMDTYAEQDSRIIARHQENAGLSAARNAGLAIAGGDYIAFVDSDDWIDLNYFQVLSERCSDADFVVSAIDYTDGSSSELQFALAGEYTGEQVLLDLMQQKWHKTIFAWGKLFHKSVIKQNMFPVNKINEDIFAIAALYFSTKKVVFTDQTYYHYFQRSDSIMHQEYSIARLDALEADLFILNLYIMHGYTDCDAARILVDRAFHRAFIGLVKGYRDAEIACRVKLLLNQLKSLYRNVKIRKSSQWCYVLFFTCPAVALPVFFARLCVKKSLSKLHLSDY